MADRFESRVLTPSSRDGRLKAVGPWRAERPTTRIVMIGSPEAMDPEALHAILDACVADPAAPSPLRTFVSRLSELSDPSFDAPRRGERPLTKAPD